MSKQEPDRHITPQVSFTLLVDVPAIKAVKVIAKKGDRTAGSVIREAIRVYLERKGA